MNRPLPLPIQRPQLHGHGLVHALWLPADWLDERSRCQRLLQLWQPGARAWRFASGDLLQLAVPRRCDRQQLRAWPLEACAGGLCSAELSAAERARLPAGDVWLVRGGQIEALFLRDGEALEPWRWLETAPGALLDTWDFQATVDSQARVVELQARPLRDIIGGNLQAPSAEQLAFMRELQQRALGASGNGTQPAAATAGPTGGSRWWVPGYLLALALLILLVSLVVRGPDPLNALGHLLFWGALALLVWRRLNRPPDEVVSGGTGAAGSGTAPAAPPLPERRMPQLPQRWRGWMERALLLTQLHQVVGRQHAAYVRRMLHLFEQGQLDEALRHALPLDARGTSLGRAFGSLQARTALNFGATGPGTHISMGEALEQHLRELYRRAFTQLDRAGRIDEAAWVLAELLNVRQEALDYLERHQRLAQAAELALLWDMPAASIVRLFVLAGDWQRALQVARRDRAFEAAVQALQGRWPDAASQLREEWADWLAARGDWLAAVEVLWPVSSARPRARQWLEQLITPGPAEHSSELAGQALLLLALLQAESLTTQRERWLQLRDDPGSWRARRGVALGALQHASQPQALAPLLRPLLNALLHDQASGLLQLSTAQLNQLLRLGNERLLRADWPAGEIAGHQARALAQHSEVLLLDAPAAGVHAVFDAVPVADRRYLLAQGEAGAVLLDGRGRSLFRFAVPADRLVVADSGEIVLALAARETRWRVSRLDLRQRQATDLGLLQLDIWADTFDGVAWMVAHGNRLQLLDTTRDLHSVLWQIADLGGRVLAWQRSARMEQMLLQDTLPEPELWTWQLPQRRLSGRERVSMRQADDIGTLLLDPAGGFASYGLQLGSGGTPVLLWQQHGRTREIPLPDAWLGQNAPRLICGEGWLLLQTPLEGELQLQWLRLDDGRCAASLMWPGRHCPSVRQLGPHWLIFDDSGRLLHLDSSSSETVRLSVL